VFHVRIVLFSGQDQLSFHNAVRMLTDMNTTTIGRWASHRFTINAEAPPDVQHGSKRQVHHCWFFPRLGDLDGDGALEIAHLRGCAFQAAWRHTGEVLWEWRDRDTAPSPLRSDSPMPIADLDGDGMMEIACVRRFAGRCHLVLLDGMSGTVKMVSPEPVVFGAGPHQETHVSLVPASLDGPGSLPCLVLHHDYHGIAVYGPDLRLRWWRTIPELGHTTTVIDVDGDGRDELFTGTRLFAGDGRERWSRVDLLAGTGESHPDSNPAVDLGGDERVGLVLGPGGRILDPNGHVIREFASLGFTEVQSVRVLRTAAGCFLALTDHPNAGGPLHWRGMPIRNVRSTTAIVAPDGRVMARIDGMHTPQVADWNGDGDDELIYLDDSGEILRVLSVTGSIISEIPMQRRVYISDLAVGPLPRNARGDHLVVHEWSDDFTTATMVILHDPDAQGKLRPRGGFELARQTTY